MMSNWDKFLFLMVAGCILSTFAMMIDFLGFYA